MDYLAFLDFYWVLLSFIGFYWVLPSFTGFYWVLLGFTGLSGCLLGKVGEDEGGRVDVGIWTRMARPRSTSSRFIRCEAVDGPK